MIKLIVLLGLFSTATMAGFKPSFVYQLDPYFGHHVIVAEKATSTLHLYKNDDGYIQLVKSYPIATGLIPGDKKVSGDKKTPEGVYITQEFLPSAELIKRYGEYGKMYGTGAFTLSYPNPFDRLKGKTGGGIWLHSTDDEERISKKLDSKGCVVVNDKNLVEISKYIDLNNTIFIIVDQITYLEDKNWNRNKQQILGMVESWRKAWDQGNFEDYISHYSKDFSDRTRGSYDEFKAYKKVIFNADLGQSVNFDHITAVTHKNYALVIMRQDYKSKTINDIGRKVLHLVRNSQYEWKILREFWSPLTITGELKFNQNQDYFNLTQAE